MTHQTPDKKRFVEFIEDHEHQDIIFDDFTHSYICTNCGLVLEGTPPQLCVHEQTEPNGRSQNETRNEWLDRDVVWSGSLILEQDFQKLSSQHKELFQRLYRANLRAISAHRQDRRRLEFDRFLQRIYKYRAFQEAFPLGPKMTKLKDQFITELKRYATQHGRQKLQNSTKIRIFLALIQPRLESKVFREMVSRVAETTMQEIYQTTKQLAGGDDRRSINMQRKQEFVNQARDLVKDAAIDPTTKQLAEEILIKRASAKGLILRKRPNILAAAALYVAASQRGPEKQISKNKARKLVGASYLPQEAIHDCEQVLQIPDKRIRTEAQEFLMVWLKQREQLLETRRALHTQLSEEVKRTFPELGEILKLKNESTLKLLAQYPSTAAIAKLGHDELSGFLQKHSHGRLQSIDKLTARILIAARTHETVGRIRPRPGNQNVIRDLIHELETVDRRRVELEQKMQKAIGAEGQTLMRTPGIGLITATIMICSRGTQAIRHMSTPSFLQQRLQDAIRIMQRNKELRIHYESLDQKVPRVEIVQHLTAQLLEPVSLTNL